MQRGRYSKFLRPISISIDLLMVVILFPCFFKGLDLVFLEFGLFLLSSWILIALTIGFYKVYRFTTPVEILTKTAKQFFLFLLIIIAFFPFYKKAIFSGSAISYYLITLMVFILLNKTALFYYIKKYRLITGNNFRTAVILGFNKEAQNLKEVFEQRKDYGYQFKGFFSEKKKNKNIKGGIEELELFCIDNKIDEIYCSLNELSNDKLRDLVYFADKNKINIKFIPDTKEIYTKNLKIDYYEMFPVLSMQVTPLHDPLIKFLKRLFDIFFSFLVLVFVLSWLIPLLGLLIKLESKGPIFFYQGRPGINEEKFYCMKFRSMKMNTRTETEACKNDPRVTRIGRFMRRTSIDELPQFINVLKGEMSVVGPRPHLWSQNITYGLKIKKYMIRHYVKPGITGLAQVKGYRGEIETDSDMINRIKYDVYYIENWSFLQDIKIIVQTVFNIFKGQEKAY